MNKLWRTLWGLAFACCGLGLIPSAAAAELNWSGLAEHPVRAAVGILLLALGVVLLLYRVLKNPVNSARKKRSYGEEPRGGSGLNVYRRSRKKRRSGSTPLSAALPTYKGGKRAASEMPTTAVPASLRRRTLRRQRVKTPPAALSYKGGRRTLSAPVLRTSQPDSYRESWGSKKRYGGFSLPALPIPYLGRKRTTASVPGAHAPSSYGGRRYTAKAGTVRAAAKASSYKGGTRTPTAAFPLRRQPDSYRERWGSKKRYGGFSLPALPIPYLGRKRTASSVPGPHAPSSYGGRRYTAKAGTVHAAAKASPYKGRARTPAASPLISLPGSYRESWGSKKRYGGFSLPALPIPYLGRKRTSTSVPGPHAPSSYGGRRYTAKAGTVRAAAKASPYKGRARTPAASPLISLPGSYRESWGSKKRYGGFSLPALPIPYLGRKRTSTSVPGPHAPSSYGGRRYTAKAGTVHAAAKASPYKGKARTPAASPLISLPGSYRERWGSKKRYGGFSLPALPIPYLGKKRTAASSVSVIHAPTSYGGRRFTAKAGTIHAAQTASYQGGASHARAATLRLATPDRYVGMHRAPSRPLRSGVPASYRGRVARAGTSPLRTLLPPSYHAPWGSPKRYGASRPIQDYRPYQGHRRRTNGEPLVDLPRSYREPWGSKKRYGNRRPVPVYRPYRGERAKSISVALASGQLARYRKPDGVLRRYRSSVPLTQLPMSYREPWGSKRRYGKGWTPDELPMSYREPWGSPDRYGKGDPLARTAIPERPHYHGGSRTSAKEPWLNPETGLPAEPNLTDAQRYGTKRYGGKLYGGSPRPIHPEEPLDASTVVQDEPPAAAN